MKAAVFIPNCCGKAGQAAREARLSEGVKKLLEAHLCGRVKPEAVINEVYGLCRKVLIKRAEFGWTAIVENCEWEGLESTVELAGGDIVYFIE